MIIEVTGWKASDGRYFDTEVDAQKHEDSIVLQRARNMLIDEIEKTRLAIEVGARFDRFDNESSVVADHLIDHLDTILPALEAVRVARVKVAAK